MPVRVITPSRAGFIIATAAIVSAINVVLYTSPVYHKMSWGPYSDDLMLEKLLSGPIEQDHPALVEWVKQMLVPPSKNDYNIEYFFSGLFQEETLGKSRLYSPSQEFTLSKVEELLGDQINKKGTFLEAGAFDGEFLSNTLSLEKNFGWNGILVEANPKFFKTLLTKNRKAWAINVCLNTKPWPSKELYVETIEDNQTNHIINANLRNDLAESHTNQGSSGLRRYAEIEKGTKINNEFQVQCIPIYSIMKALGVSHIDFLSLDVQGAEMGILDTIPWDKVSFSIMSIEHKTLDDMREYLRPKGYIHVDSFLMDHVFINKNQIFNGRRDPAPSGSQYNNSSTIGNHFVSGFNNGKEKITFGIPQQHRLRLKNTEA